jgi:hypothetical protein
MARTEAGIAAIDALDAKLAGPRNRLKTRAAIEQAAANAGPGPLRKMGHLHHQRDDDHNLQAGRTRPAQRRDELPGSPRHRLNLNADIALERIAHDAASDGCFPLITCDRDLSDADGLGAYRYQPNLERRHHLLKAVQDAAPVLLHSPARIEALFCCQ